MLKTEKSRDRGASHGLQQGVTKSAKRSPIIRETLSPTAQRAIEAARKRFPLIDRNGVGGPTGRHDDWQSEAIKIAIKWLRTCKKTVHPVYNSYPLKGRIERAEGYYISNGDCIVAAVYLGFVVVQPHDYKRHGNPNVFIGVAMKDIRRLERIAEERRLAVYEMEERERETLSPQECERNRIARLLKGYPQEVTQ